MHLILFDNRKLCLLHYTYVFCFQNYLFIVDIIFVDNNYNVAVLVCGAKEMMIDVSKQAAQS